MEKEICHIKNADAIATSELRKSAVEIINAGLASIDTGSAIRKRISFLNDNFIVDGTKYSFKDVEKVFLVGIGKCSAEAVLSLEEILKDRLDGGIVLDISCRETPKKVVFYKCDHPLPTEANAIATQRLIKFLEACSERDRVIFIISGGGSTMLCQPENMKCEDESEIFKGLMAGGATIQEINTIRKHLSLARGGFLAKYAYPAKSIALFFSDVAGEDISFIASGPVSKDQTTIKDALSVFEKYKAAISFDYSALHLIETPKDDKYFKNVAQILFISDDNAIEGMQNKARDLGFDVHVETDKMHGETKVVGANIAEKISRTPQNTALLYGGETTVSFVSRGQGGRNQELVLSALKSLADDTLVASVNSDGWDNTPFAGAIGDKTTLEKAIKLKIDPEIFLQEHNSHEFFKKIGDGIVTGITGANVSDLVIAIKK